jgi:hypothetical protein
MDRPFFERVLPAYNPAMICNIDAKGRRFRAVSGIACLVIGLAMAGTAILFHYMVVPLCFTGLAIALCGGFQIFESRKGWCALRAMGIRTRL